MSSILSRDFEDIGVNLDGHVAVVEIQRPPHNFFDFRLIEQLADALIVGSWYKRDGHWAQPPDPERVETLVRAVKTG